MGRQETRGVERQWEGKGEGEDRLFVPRAELAMLKDFSGKS